MGKVVLAKPRRDVVMIDETTAVVKLKWFHFGQNNSGGHFVVDDIQCEDVFVQAMSAQEAIDRIWDQLDHSYCECCGERWSNYLDDDDGTDQPTVYGEVIWNREKSMFHEEVRLHYYDGHVEKYVYGQPQPAVLQADVIDV